MVDLSDSLAMFGSPWHWLILLLIVVLLFGGSRIPEMMKGFGSGVREFKKGLADDEAGDSDKAKK